MGVRPAEKKDASRIAEILVFGNRVNFYPIFREDEYSFGELQVVPMARKYEENDELRARTYVYDDGIVRGVMQVKVDELEKLYVDPFFTGRGIGGELIEYAKERLKIRWLWALEKNTGAIRFYERHGFCLTDEKVFEEGTTEYLVKMVLKNEVRIDRRSPDDPEVLRLFSAHDDFMIDFLGEDCIYYTRYGEHERLEAVWAATIDGETVGCAAYRTKETGVGEVKRVFVREEFRGTGISKQLMDAVEAHAREEKCERLFLDTRITLEPAVSIYRKRGFEEIFRQGLYVQMEKRI